MFVEKLPMIDKEKIEKFLEGEDEQKHIVKIITPSYTNKAHLVVRNPHTNQKEIQTQHYKPFIWVNPDFFHDILLDTDDETEYNSRRYDLRRKMSNRGVTVKGLHKSDENGHVPDRIENGYTNILHCNGSWSNLLNFLNKDMNDLIKKYIGEHKANVNIFEEGYKEYFVRVKPIEQFMIQTGKRLFKGFEDYEELHKFYFDLETSGIDSYNDRIFQIGVRDNVGFDGNGYEEIIEVKGDTAEELRNSEREAIKRFFKLINELHPDIIAGYNSENFDWPFIEGRCEVLKVDPQDIVTPFTPENKKKPFIRANNVLKLGNETEWYEQTHIEGYNILDTSHAVRKAKAINSDIKRWGLEYITQYAEANKPNRVYIPGDQLYPIWEDMDNLYALNDENGDWHKLENVEDEPKEGYEKVSGSYLVERYLQDDLWETEKVDDMFSQATFLIGKLIPTDYMRNCTMGTSGIWKLIMLTWSYKNNLAVPQEEDKKDFPGGLSRMLLIGRSENVVKLDYSALYPRTELTHDIFPELDISGVMKGLLEYIVNTRDEYKSLKGEYEKLSDNAEDEGEKKEYKQLSEFYDKKQLPLKILANSFFGSFGAPHIFPWGETISAGETTCRGRQYLRLMIKFFYDRGYTPLVCDSVTGRTPIYVKDKKTGELDILPIMDLFDESSSTINEFNQERDFDDKGYFIMTKEGWEDINYVYRHKTNKNIHRLSTRDSYIECTSDHSLFSNGKEIKPSELERGDKVDKYNDLNKSYNIIDNNLNEDFAWLIGFFVADGSSIYGDKNRKYFSKRKNRLVEHKTKRSEFTINNNDKEKLREAKKIIDREFGIDSKIKDYKKSSGVFKLKTHYAIISQFFGKNCYTKHRSKKIPKEILNANNSIKKAFLNGFSYGDGWGDNINELKNITQKSQTVLAGISFLLKDDNIDKDYCINLRKDKKDIITFNFGEIYNINETKSFKNNDEIWSNTLINNDQEYVYDISSNGTFVAGIGGLIAHNTDGANFSMPLDANKRTYIPDGSHAETKDDKGKKLVGLDADVAEFNEKYMIGYMGLDVDELAEAEINFSKKNYATLQDGKVKKTGNTLKSDILEDYIKDFLDRGLELLLKGEGYDFIQEYYQLVEDLYNYRVPISKIASKNKVKMTREQYTQYCKETKRDGTPNSRQAWMELIEYYDLDVKLGDVIYYYNTGTAKSNGDIAKKKDKETGEVEIKLNCELVDNNIIDNHPDTKYTDYNVPRYIDKLNSRIKPLLVCFHPDIRNDILISVKKDKKTKQYVLTEKREFTKKQCELVSGYPFEDKHQDDLWEDLLKMEDKEIDFWLNSIQKIPNNIDKDEWERTKKEYIEKLGDTLEKEKRKFENIVQGLEIDELDNAKQYHHLPHQLHSSFKLEKDEILTKDGKNKIADFNDIFKYEDEARERQKYYKEHKNLKGNGYDSWRTEKFNKELDGHNIVDEVIDDKDIKSSIKMKKGNISLIKQGKKKATSRTFSLNNGLHRIQQDGTVLELKGKYVNHISELKDPEKWAQAEGYDSLEDMRNNCSFDHTREFIEGNRGLYIYQIKNVYPN